MTEQEELKAGDTVSGTGRNGGLPVPFIGEILRIGTIGNSLCAMIKCSNGKTITMECKDIKKIDIQ